MKLESNNNDSSYVIRSYDRKCINVNDKLLTQSFIITSDQLIQNWSPRHLTELSIDDLELIINLEPEIIILGCGTRLCFPEAVVTAPVISRNIGFEVMDTHAACRCFTILISEGRNVAAGMILE